MISMVDAEIDALLLVIDGAKNEEDRRSQVKAFLFQTFLDAKRWRQNDYDNAKRERLKRLERTA